MLGSKGICTLILATKVEVRCEMKVVKNILGLDPNFSDRYIDDYTELAEIVELLKQLGYKIVLTQGVFDLMHQGHAKYLEEAKKLGDILIVGMDSDELTKQRKGPTRPIVPQAERAEMLMHLRHVQIVALRNVDTDMNELIRVVSPDVLVVSETTQDFPDDLQESLRPYYQEKVRLPAQAQTSTTARVSFLLFDGAHQLSTVVTTAIAEYMDRLRGEQS